MILASPSPPAILKAICLTSSTMDTSQPPPVVHVSKTTYIIRVLVSIFEYPSCNCQLLLDIYWQVLSLLSWRISLSSLLPLFGHDMCRRFKYLFHRHRDWLCLPLYDMSGGCALLVIFQNPARLWSRGNLCDLWDDCLGDSGGLSCLSRDWTRWLVSLQNSLSHRKTNQTKRIRNSDLEHSAVLRWRRRPWILHVNITVVLIMIVYWLCLLADLPHRGLRGQPPEPQPQRGAANSVASLVTTSKMYRTRYWWNATVVVSPLSHFLSSRNWWKFTSCSREYTVGIVIIRSFSILMETPCGLILSIVLGTPKCVS